MPNLKPRRYFSASPHFQTYFEQVHAQGALDAKTKELMHLALVLAFHCEP
jgi:alkylhydroperoxidase/carboxymuconolactone decarboxylase family protein YurZ